MTTETQRRIRAYKRALPELRERVAAVALLLVMSASMLASASFAWITLSRAPEAAGMQTTVAANGNLEIALVQGSVNDPIKEPDDSKEGDSSATEGQTIVGSNVTWGNLVNVSDPSYGLSSIALRPALLNTFTTKDNPLMGATYGLDGRVVATDELYDYATYTKVDGTVDEYYFAAGNKVNYGVRAISSVAYSNVAADKLVSSYRTATHNNYAYANAEYARIVSEDPDDNPHDLDGKGTTCITALEGLVTVFAQNKINEMNLGPSSASTSVSPYLWHVYLMMGYLQDVLDYEADALMTMANWQAYNKAGEEGGNATTFGTAQALRNAVAEELAKSGKALDQSRTLAEIRTAVNAAMKPYNVSLSTLPAHLKNYVDLAYCLSELEPMAVQCKVPNSSTNPEYVWDDIDHIIPYLVDVTSTTINGIPLSSVSAGNATTVMGGGPVIIKKGMLVDVETRVINNEDRMDAPVQVTVRTVIPGFTNKKVDGTVYTSAYSNTTTSSATDVTNTDVKADKKGEATAKDTYGIALDLWLRTNYPNAILTLEGALQTTTESVYGYDDEDNRVELWEVTVEGTPYTLYQKNGKWFLAGEHEEVTTEELKGNTPTQKVIETISGYEGLNRVWETRDDWEELLAGGYIQKDATTQGAGSCFVFYANSPTEEAKILELLDAFTVVFLADDGTTLGTARLKTEDKVQNQGKITVAMEMVTGTPYVDSVTGKEKIGIAQLTQNQATRVTAIVYLNGSKIMNENVLANGEIQGQLNIQFGTNAQIIAPKDEALMGQHRTITASVSVNGQVTPQPGDDNDTITLEYSETGHKTTVTLTVDGEQPKRIQGFYVRTINDTQGSRGDVVDFLSNGDGETWSAEITLTSPGTYVFNGLIVDGTQYTLQQEEFPRISIKGLALGEISTAPKVSGTYMVADKVFTVPVSVEVDAAVPVTSVSAVFFNGNGTEQVTVPLRQDSVSANKSVWKGTGNITSSDTYTLSSIMVNGQPYEVPASQRSVLEVLLGLKAEVLTHADTTNFEFEEARQIQMYAYIYNDNNRPIQSLTGLTLTYGGLSETPLEWNSDHNHYHAILDVTEAGDYKFSQLKLGSMGTLYSTINDAPVIRALNTKPVSVDRIQTVAEQMVLASDKTATMEMTMTNGSTAKVWALVKQTDQYGNLEDTHLILGEIPTTVDNKNMRIFELPREDGYYEMVTLYIRDALMDGVWMPDSSDPVYDFNSHVYNLADHGYTGSTAIKTKVVTTVTPSLKYNGAAVSANEIVKTGTFLQELTTDTMTVSFVDFTNTPVNSKDIAVTWNLSYSNKMVYDYGKYTGTKNRNFPISLTNDGNGVYTGTAKLPHAGEYTTSSVTYTIGGTSHTILDYVIDGTSYTKPVNAPKFAVKTSSPTVTVKSTTPTPGTTKRVYMVKEPYDASQAVTGDFFRKTDYSATVYIHTPTGGGTFDQEAAEAYAPSVTLALAGVPTGYTSATMEFITQNADSKNAVFDFGNSTTATAEVGYAITGERGYIGVSTYPKCYPAGVMTQNQITITYGDDTYTVDLSHEILIDNPMAPAILKFTGIPESYTGTRPEQVQGEGSVVTVTLPKEIMWTARIEEPRNGTWSAYTSKGEVTDASGNPVGRVYGYAYWQTDGTCGSKNDNFKYQYYIWTKFESSIEAETDIYTQAKKITKWKINGVTYNAGETVTVAGNGVINAEAVVEDNGVKTFVETLEQITYKYLYGYVKESSTRTSANGGEQIGDTVGQNDTLPAAKCADATKANAATDTPGTNMTTDVSGYDDYWP